MSDMVLAFWTRLQNLKLDADERGATAVEYGMIVALIAAVIIVAVTALGTQVNGAFNKIVGKF
jgi:pilus assembly protein Flp/PilA